MVVGIAHAASFRFSFAVERWSSENGRGRFYNNCRSVGFARGIDLPVLCFALSLALSHGEREWVGWETPSGRETKNGSVVAWALLAILLQRSSEICIWVSAKLAAFVLTSLMLCFQTTLLCLKPCGRGHSPRYFFSAFPRQSGGRLKTGKAGFITIAMGGTRGIDLPVWCRALSRGERELRILKFNHFWIFCHLEFVSKSIPSPRGRRLGRGR